MGIETERRAGEGLHGRRSQSGDPKGADCRNERPAVDKGNLRDESTDLLGARGAVEEVAVTGFFDRCKDADVAISD